MPLRLYQSLAVVIWVLLLVVGVTPARPGTLTPGTFYAVGTGPAGPEHATQRAMEVIKEADYILCDDDMKKRFPIQLHEKQILADPWKGMWSYKGKPWKELKPEEKRAYQEELVKIREDIIRQIKEKLIQGKTVALLDSGDPCLFGPSHWFLEGFAPQQVEIIPGVGAFTASMAALKKSSLPAHEARFVMQTSPLFLTENPAKAEKVVKDLAQHPVTMVFYMGMEELDSLISMLEKFHPGELPIAVVYNAGYPEKEKVLQGTLDNILDKTAGAKKERLAMVIVGRCLEGQPLRSAAERLNRGED